MLESKVVVPPLMLKGGFFFAFIFTLTAFGLGQEVTLINQPKRHAPFIVVLSEKGEVNTFKDLLGSYTDKRGTAFLSIETEGSSLETIIDTINYRLNYTAGIDLIRCYLMIVGSREYFQELASIDGDAFFSKRVYLTEEEYPKNSGDFMVTSLADHSLEHIIDQLSQSHLWQIGLNKIKEDNVSDLNQNLIETGVFMRANAVIPSYSGIESSVKPFFRTFSVGIYHRWGRRWQSNLDFTLGLNVPTQRRIQNQVQGAGSSGEDIELDVKAHILRSFGLETRYLLQPENKSLNPYVGLHFGHSYISATEMTVEVDQDDIAAGRFERPEGFSSDDFESIAGPIAGITSGIQLTLSDRFLMNAGLRWSHDLKTITDVAEPYFNNFSFSVGFNFRFTGKKVLYYDYVTTKNEF